MRTTGRVWRGLLYIYGYVLLTSSILAGDSTIPSKYEKLYDEFMNIDVNKNRTVAISNIVLQRSVGIFTLEHGTISICTPINGRECAVYFKGKGHFNFAPSAETEREQLQRFFKNTELDERFDRLFLIFADNTLEELESRCTFGSNEALENASFSISECYEFMGEKNDKEFDVDIMKTFLDEARNILFYAHIWTENNGPLIFKCNPYPTSYNPENISLSRKGHYTYLDHVPEVISQFRSSGVSISQQPGETMPGDLIRVNKYTINTTIERNHHFSATAKIQFVPEQINQRWLYLELYSKAVVDSVLQDDGKKISFFKGEENTLLWITFDSTLEKNRGYSVIVYYHSNDLIKIDELGWVAINEPDSWYPNAGYHAKSIYDLTFTFPQDLKLVSVGDNIGTTTNDDMVTSHWLTIHPVYKASFNIGFFQEKTFERDSIPTVVIYKSTVGHQEVASSLGEMGISSGGHMEEDVGADVLNSVSFFQKLFGPCSSKKLYATEIPFSHGEAFPGLMHLSWWTFQRTDKEGDAETFRAHEVAHQWWGIGLKYKDYHDQWLSEGFSDYCALMYLQMVHGDNISFFKMLNDYKDDILTVRKYILGSGQESGPISLGYRTSSSTTAGDYNLIIYKKGAWVLHMLRNMMINLKTMNEDLFLGMMKEFYTQYQGGKASTDDFQKVVEKAWGGDLRWFFDQWVQGTKIPKYEFAFLSEQTIDGKYKVQCKVKQSEVDDTFQVIVPILVDFGEGKFTRLRVHLRSSFSQFDLPLLPMRPQKIIFNDLNSVLCEVDNVDWNDIKNQ
jgi:hypothetical protein